MRFTSPRAPVHATRIAVMVAGLCVAAVAARADSAGTPAAVQVSPVDLDVVDLDATVAIASKAGERLPLVVSHDPELALDVIREFDEAFARTREAFLERMSAVLGARVLGADALLAPEYRQFRADFQAENLLVPVGPALAQTWARGYDGEPARERMAAVVRAIQRDALIGEIRPASSVFVVPASLEVRVRTWGEVGDRARAVDPRAVLSVSAAGELLRRSSDPLDRAAGGYLSGLLRSNLREDRHLTVLLVRDRLGAAAVQRQVVRGTPLLREGKPVDRWAELALEQMAWLGILPVDAVEAPSQAVSVPPQSSAGTAPQPGPRLATILWTVAGAAALSGAVAVLFVLVVRRRRSTGILLVTGERPTGQAPAEAVIPHMARELKDRLVRALFTQRSVLLANEQAASRRVQEMEERLARLQPAIAERIRSYEQRIEALEKEIAERDADTRELLRAKLVLARKELDAEVARNRITWN